MAERQFRHQKPPGKMYRPLDLHHAGYNVYLFEMTIKIGQFCRDAQRQGHAILIDLLAEKFGKYHHGRVYSADWIQ